MDHAKFWTLIGKIDREALRSSDEDGAVGPLIEALAEHSEGEIKEFENILAQCLYDLDGRIYADEAEESGRSADGFLYARCYVVARGKEYYEAVKADPTKMPKTLDEWCETLLTVAQTAWAAVTGEDAESWFSDTPVSYETGSNESGWA